MVKPTAFDLWDSGIHPSSRAQIANHSKSIAILERAGFNDDSFRIGDLVGRTIALNRSMFHCLFLMYKISGIAETEHGFIVVPVSDEVRFYGNVEGKLSYLSQPVSNLELYVPKFYMSQTHGAHTFLGGDFIAAERTLDPFAIGWKYPHKQYLSEEQIRQQEPDLSDRIDARLAKCKMDVSGLVEQLRVAACQHGIEVEVEYRTKTFASCYANIKRIQQTIRPRVPEFIYDINGIRLLPKTPNDCYALLNIAHGLVEFDDVRDLILFPKSNCFQGLICMAKDKDLSLEVQIQTPRMKQIAETVAGNYRNGYRP